MNKQLQNLTGGIRQSCWLGRAMSPAAHKSHSSPLSANDVLVVRLLPAQSPNQRKLNDRIISMAADFGAVANLSCCQAASFALHDFIVKLMWLGVSLPCEELRRIVDIGREWARSLRYQELTQSVREPNAGWQSQLSDLVHGILWISWLPRVIFTAWNWFPVS
jgi:hypothetical protein